MVRRGVTLIELLIVILIMLLITAIVIPATAPALNGRRIREAARMLDVYINGARSRALQTGRSYGVMIERTPVLNAGTGFATSSMGIAVAYAEVPPQYSGDYGNSTIHLLGNGGFGVWLDWPPAGPNYSSSISTAAADSVFTQGDIGWMNTVSPGDYLIIPPGSSNVYRLYAGEPYIDVNNNGIYDPGEPYADCNLNGSYTFPYPNPNFVDPVTGFFTLNAFNNAALTSAVTYMFADAALAARTMNPTGQIQSPTPGGPVFFWPNSSAYVIVIVGGVPVHVPVPGFTSVDGTNPPGAPGTPGTSFGYSFQIIRRPIKAAGTDMQLPDGAAIDLGGFDFNANPAVPADVVPGSGLDIFPFATFRPNPYYQSNPAIANYSPDGSPVIITFAPNGIVDKVFSWDERTFATSGGNTSVVNSVPVGWVGRQPGTPIYLLVTRRELVGGDASVTIPSAAAPQYGIQDMTSLWVTINPQTGLVNTAANAPVSFNLSYAIQCYEARQNARKAQNVGGR